MGADQIPEDEADIWSGLGVAWNPELWLEHLRVLKRQHNRLVDRICDYVEARDLLRGALAASEFVARIADETGQLRDLTHHTWRREAAADVIEKGRGAIEGLETMSA